MMDKNEMLTLSYSTLHNMLDDAQHDGLFADGCCYDLDYDIDEEIKRNIESGDIKIVEDYNNGSYISREEAKADSDKYQWFPVSERLPENNEAVNITYVNHDPESYYSSVKDKPFTATGVYFSGSWYWWSSTVQDYLDEYGRFEPCKIDEAVEILAWQPLPEPYKKEGQLNG